MSKITDLLEAKAKQQVLKYAAGRFLWCKVSGNILDYRTMVMVEFKPNGAPGTSTCFTGVAYDALVAKGFLEKLAEKGTYEIIDGRELEKQVNG